MAWRTLKKQSLAYGKKLTLAHQTENQRPDLLACKFHTRSIRKTKTHKQKRHFAHGIRQLSGTIHLMFNTLQQINLNRAAA